MDEKLIVSAMEKAKELGFRWHSMRKIRTHVRAGRTQRSGSGKDRIRRSSQSSRRRDGGKRLYAGTSHGASVCIQHISSGNSVELVRLAKKLGADVHAEATPHHFTLTEEAVLKYGTMARMNPPLRTEADRQAIIEGIKDGTIDMIVTDHAPHSAEEKARPMAQAPSGITGLETSLALGIHSLVEPDILR